MYEEDRTPVTLNETHQLLEPSERTIKQAATLPLTELTFTAGNIAGSNDRQTRLVAPACDLPVAAMGSNALPAREAGITTLK